MRVLLVKPHSWFSAKGVGLPLGLAYLGGELLRSGHEVGAIDLMLSKPEEARADLSRRISEFAPDLVGITCNSHERLAAFEAARWTKSFGDIPVVMGGPHVTFTAEHTLERVREVDVVALHEGEQTLLAVCNAIASGVRLEDVESSAVRPAKHQVLSGAKLSRLAYNVAGSRLRGDPPRETSPLTARCQDPDSVGARSPRAAPG